MDGVNAIKGIDQLFEKFPELKERKIEFSDYLAKILYDSVPNDQPISICEQNNSIAIISGHSDKIEIRKSPIHGYGVFAKQDIATGELIEQTKLLKLGLRKEYQHDPVLKDYVWGNRSCDCSDCKAHGVYQYLALGFGSIYNHDDHPNAQKELDFKKEILTITALTAIERDREITIHYGSKYWLIRSFWKNIRQENNI